MIGAALSASFQSSVSSANRKLHAIGEAIADLNRQKASFKPLEKAEYELDAARAKLAEARRTVLDLRKAMETSPSPALKKSLDEAVKASEGLARAVEAKRAKLREAKAAMEASGVATGDYRNQLARLGSALDAARAKQTRLGEAVRAHDELLQKRASMRGQLFDTVAIGAGLTGLFKGAGETQSVLTDIGITAGLSAARMRAVGVRLGELAVTTHQSSASLAEGFKTLIAAGLDPERAIGSIEAIGKTATASGAEVNDVAKTVFSLLDNLKVAPGDAIKAMDMLTEAGKQGRFELKDMAQYFPMLTAEAQKLGMTGTAAVAGLGSALQVALKGAADPAEAANNMRNYLAKLTAPETVKNFKKFGVDLENEFARWAKAGINPIEASLKLIQKLTGGDGFRIGELFGDMQVKSFITPMLANMEEYKRIKGEVMSASGTVDADLARRANEDPTVVWRDFGESLKQLRDAVITPLLPPLGKMIGLITDGARAVGQFASQHEWLVSNMATLGAAMLAGKVGITAVGYAFTFVKGAFLALRVAMLANPIGAIIAGIALAGVLVWKNWDAIKTGIASAWTWLSNTASRVVTAIGSAWSDLTGLVSRAVDGAIAYLKSVPGRMIQAGVEIGRGLSNGIKAGAASLWDGGKELANQAVGSVKDTLGIKSPSRVMMGLGQHVTEGLRLGIAGGEVGVLGQMTGLARKLAAPVTAGAIAMSGAAMAAPAGPGVTIHNSFEITIHAAAGQDAQAIARTVMAEIERAQSSTRRGALGDWA